MLCFAKERLSKGGTLLLLKLYKIAYATPKFTEYQVSPIQRRGTMLLVPVIHFSSKSPEDSTLGFLNRHVLITVTCSVLGYTKMCCIFINLLVLSSVRSEMAHPIVERLLFLQT